MLHVEYAERRLKYGILFTFSLFYEYCNLAYVRIHVLHRVNQAQNAIYILLAASHYSTRRGSMH